MSAADSSVLEVVRSNEFYGPNNTPNPHNLRPFETGPLLDALLEGTGPEG